MRFGPASRFAAAQMSVLSLSRNGQAFSRYQERSEGCVGAISIATRMKPPNRTTKTRISLIARPPLLFTGLL